MKSNNFEKMAKYERYFTTAVKAQWSSYPGREALQEMLDVWYDETNCPRAYHHTCGSCVLSLITDVGKIYFKEQERRAKVVATSEAPAESKKAEVKTKKSKK